MALVHRTSYLSSWIAYEFRVPELPPQRTIDTDLIGITSQFSPRGSIFLNSAQSIVELEPRVTHLKIDQSRSSVCGRAFQLAFDLRRRPPGLIWIFRISLLGLKTRGLGPPRFNPNEVPAKGKSACRVPSGRARGDRSNITNSCVFVSKRRCIACIHACTC